MYVYHFRLYTVQNLRILTNQNVIIITKKQLAMESVAELELAANRVNMCLGAERQLLDRNAKKRRIPVTIVTGFLGAGKTSLLWYILLHKLNLHVACIVSDLAAINVDALLVADQNNKSTNKLFELKADLDGNLHDFKNVTSGTTDPTQLVAAVEENFGKMTRARLDSVVTVVDGDALAPDTMQGVELCAVAIRQLQCADVVLLNKVDLLDLTKLRFARKVIEKYAPNARLYETNHSQVYLPHVLDIAPPEDVFNGGISHEKVQGQWNTGLSAWNNSIKPGASRLRVENSRGWKKWNVTPNRCRHLLLWLLSEQNRCHLPPFTIGFSTIYRKAHYAQKEYSTLPSCQDIDL
ncbi:putative cobW/HypB/UreG, nucleotide-binding domain-containing protein [Plasmopara halstedii]